MNTLKLAANAKMSLCYGDEPYFLSQTVNQFDIFAGYKLYDAGYDVWLADLRGNEYSLEHNTLKKTDPKFWEFS